MQMLKMRVAGAAMSWALLATSVWPAIAQEPPSVFVTTPIQFADEAVGGPLAPRDIVQLLTRRVTDKGIWLDHHTQQHTGNVQVSSCLEYLYLTRHGWEVQFSMAELNNMRQYEWVCWALELMSTARPYQHSRIEGVRIGANGLALFPAVLLPAWSPTDIDDESQISPQLEKSGRTFAALRDEGKITITVINPDQISIRYVGSQRDISEIARADFDGDGENDILALVNDAMMDTRGFSVHLMVLSLDSKSAVFAARKPKHDQP